LRCLSRHNLASYPVRIGTPLPQTGTSLLDSLRKAYNKQTSPQVHSNTFQEDYRYGPKNIVSKFLHGDDICAHYVLVELFELLLKLIQRYFVVLNDKVDLQLVDSVTDRYQLAQTPHKAVPLD